MNNREIKKLEAERHNEKYFKSKKPKQVARRKRQRSKKTAQMLAIMMAASVRSFSGGV